MQERYERGTVLTMLKESRGLEMSVAFWQLQHSLDEMGLVLSGRKLRGHLEYLAAKGYITATRRQDMPGCTREQLEGNQTPEHIVAVKLTVRGLDLLEGNLPKDAGVVL